MAWYHVTPIENVETIKSKGLKVGAKSTSVYGDLKGVYLTSDYKDLLQSGTYPEIWDFKEVAIFKVVNLKFGKTLLKDPEYEDDDWIRISPNDISPENLELIDTLENKGRYGTSMRYVSTMPKVKKTKASKLLNNLDL